MNTSQRKAEKANLSAVSAKLLAILREHATSPVSPFRAMAERIERRERERAADHYAKLSEEATRSLFGF